MKWSIGMHSFNFCAALHETWTKAAGRLSFQLTKMQDREFSGSVRKIAKDKELCLEGQLYDPGIE